MDKEKISEVVGNELFGNKKNKVKISHWITAEAKKELKDAAYSEGLGEGEYLTQLIMIAKKIRINNKN